MRFNTRARLDTRRTVDRGRGAGGGGPAGFGGGGLPIPTGLAGGGIGGVVVLVLVVVVLQFVGGGGGTSSSGGFDTSRLGSGEERYASCETGADANESVDCARVAVENSLHDFWSRTLPEQTGTAYEEATLATFTGSVGTGCGGADSSVGPFYCPVDDTVYLDTTFFDEVLEQQLGGPDGGFVEPYVLAHEYGHRVQDLLGTMGQVRTQQGPTSDAVRLELQADCYAGMWAAAATSTETADGEPLIVELTQEDVQQAVDAAEAIGDDRIQEKAQGQVTPETWTHGSAEQRVRWFRTGFEQGTVEACDTFAARTL